MKFSLYCPISSGSFPAQRNIAPDFLADPIAWAEKVGNFMDSRKIDDVVVDKPNGHATDVFDELDVPPPDVKAFRRVVEILNQGHRRMWVYLHMPPKSFFGYDIFGKAASLSRWLAPYAGCRCIMDSAGPRWEPLGVKRADAQQTFSICDLLLTGDLGVEHWPWAGTFHRHGLGTSRMLGPASWRDADGKPPAQIDHRAFNISGSTTNFWIDHHFRWDDQDSHGWKQPEYAAGMFWAARRFLSPLLDMHHIEYWGITGDNWQELAVYDVLEKGAQEA